MNFVEVLVVHMREIASACTQCGKYLQARHVVGAGRYQGSGTDQGLVRPPGGPSWQCTQRPSERPASAYSSSGFCIEAYDYRVTPRTMVRLAHRAMFPPFRITIPSQARAAWPSKFKLPNGGENVQVHQRRWPNEFRTIPATAGRWRQVHHGRCSCQGAAGLCDHGDQAAYGERVSEVSPPPAACPTGQQAGRPSIAWRDNRQTADLVCSL